MLTSIIQVDPLIYSGDRIMNRLSRSEGVVNSRFPIRLPLMALRPLTLSSLAIQGYRHQPKKRLSYEKASQRFSPDHFTLSDLKVWQLGSKVNR
ncbi:hypothetical protein [Limnospira sp. PMC 1242.20]|uniref:hypothetical protein n=1 Tax=Limnospira sp. PMC 1242.20 TaxID=2981040 RepID=UPI0028ECE85F|nr:hypothetical protein [Limnospira sp. PMC 1242.20]